MPITNRRKVNKDRRYPKGSGGHKQRLNNREARRQGVLERLGAQLLRFAGNKEKADEIKKTIAHLREKWSK